MEEHSLVRPWCQILICCRPLEPLEVEVVVEELVRMGVRLSVRTAREVVETISG